MPTQLTPLLSANLLKQLPMGVVVFSQNKIIWANPWLLEYLQTTLDLLIGIDKKSADEAGFAALFEKEDTLCLTNAKGETHWLQRQQANADDHILHYYQDITALIQLVEERNQLREKARSLSTKEAITGLLNKKAILSALDIQVSRSRRYQNPLSLVKLTISSQHSDHCNETQLRTVSNILKSQLRWADQVGYFDKDTFLIILPETTLNDARNLIEKLSNTKERPITTQEKLTCVFAFEEWHTGDDPRKLLNRLKEAQTGVSTI